jgi:hypothetical protein
MKILSLRLVMVSLAFALAAGCGSSNQGGRDAAAGTDGGDIRADAADTAADLAQDVAPDLAPEAPPVVDASDASDAAAEVATDASDAAAETAPPLDAGFDCLAPSGEAALVPATEGVSAAGLVLWLRGDRGVYKTAANAVCAWADQSGKGWLFTPYAGRPTWLPTGVGGKPAIRSTATGEGLSTSGVLGIAPTSARTIIAVVQLSSLTKRFAAVFAGQSGTPGTYLGLDTNTFNTIGQREGVYMMNNAYDSSLATSLTPRVHTYTIQTMTVGTPVLSGIGYRVDGAALTLTRTAGGLGNGNFENFATANYTSVATTNEGTVAEVLIYDRALTATEAGTVEAALKTRYGIQ